MMSRVFLICMLVIHIVLYIIYKVGLIDNLSFRFISFINNHKFLLYYLVIINIITIICFALDKIFAIENRKRIRIITLLGLCFLGGSIGGLVSMKVFRHKTQVDYFTIGIPLIIITQIFLLFFIMNYL